MKIPKQTTKSCDLSKNFIQRQDSSNVQWENRINNSIQSQKEALLLFSSALHILSELKLEREIKFWIPDRQMFHPADFFFLV